MIPTEEMSSLGERIEFMEKMVKEEGLLDQVGLTYKSYGPEEKRWLLTCLLVCNDKVHAFSTILSKYPDTLRGNEPFLLIMAATNKSEKVRNQSQPTVGP